LIDDDPPGVGPVGGLVALLREGPAVVVACDMPFVTDALLRRLVAAPVQAPIVAPRRDGRWEPLFARYDVSVLPFARSRIAHGQLGLQGLLDEGGAAELPMEANEWAELADWDTLPP
jgi:molybdopterin-guanine dinucleotide biosynthesis protein A